MRKIIKLNKNIDKTSSLTDMIYGTPCEFNFLGKTVQCTGSFYKLKKHKEFFEQYWPKFQDSLADINPYSEFNTNYVINNYNSLSTLEQKAVALECSEIYSLNNELTYANFVDVVNLYVSKKPSKSESDFSGFDHAA